MSLLLGADAGGSTVRAALADLEGTVHAVVTGPAANPNAVGPAEAVQRIAAVLTEVLAGADPAEVIGLAVGLAGATRGLGSPLADLRPAGVGVEPQVLPDVVTAYASGTPAPTGSVLLAGTGSIAAAVDGTAVIRRAGGRGWLLGDEGSGFWLGREAVRHTLAGGDGPLADAVGRAYGAADTDALSAAVYAAPPHRLATLGVRVAALVADDPAAAALVEAAADHLLALLAAVGPQPGPVVLAGSVLAGGPVGHRVGTRLAALGVPVAVAGPSVVGPLWLARLRTGPAPDPAVHARLRVTAAASAPPASSTDCG